MGMLTDRDLAIRALAQGKDPARTKVREAMTAEMRYVFEDEDVHRAADLMAEQQVRRLPVLSRGKRLVGIVSLGDIATTGHSPRLAGHAVSGIAYRGSLRRQTTAS